MRKPLDRGRWGDKGEAAWAGDHGWSRTPPSPGRTGADGLPCGRVLADCGAPSAGPLARALDAAIGRSQPARGSAVEARTRARCATRRDPDWVPPRPPSRSRACSPVCESRVALFSADMISAPCAVLRWSRRSRGRPPASGGAKAPSLRRRRAASARVRPRRRSQRLPSQSCCRG